MGEPKTRLPPGLPSGVFLHPLTTHRDSRGGFTEVFRESWGVGVRPVQWNVLQSGPGVLRGVHVHAVHDDYLLVLQGRASIGLCDLRKDADPERRSALVELTGEDLAALVIPHGVAHGFYIHGPTVMLLGVSHDFDPADELGVRWDDPELGIPWPVDRAVLSPRDAALPSLRELRRAFATTAGWSGL
ncbi:dTDP-4-dehydrorhamnose 3,5-epimerase family protein [Pyxidicoccus caerfyrddinensis]|uniref:dTDP-4-dehydrorhamnose 3,5-epimerase family protein n=1 Tax=Pyxidicoccus caerfyrddinensis TaxID=2709663 RepID=UPI0013DB97A1|nr:dTDP-4-dehydrorhamnose 3,5-epimerase family protein [Pyxidicoccus caerfyrddinensis]